MTYYARQKLKFLVTTLLVGSSASMLGSDALAACTAGFPATATNTSTTCTYSTTGNVSLLDNNGLINTSGIIFLNSGHTITTLTNENGASIVSTNSFGIANNFEGTITTLNNGVGSTISDGGSSSSAIFNGYTDTTHYSTIGTINNSGNILSSTTTFLRGAIQNGGHINTIQNNAGALISGGTKGIIVNGGSQAWVGSIINSGTIRGGTLVSGVGIYMPNGSIGSITNNASGVISATTGDGINIISSSVTTLTNLGIINGSSGYSGILNSSGTIGTFNNAQGGDSSGTGAITSPLTYQLTLPTNYNTIINSSTHYGQLYVDSASGSTTFGISTDSKVGPGALGAYSSVLRGVSSNALGFGGAASYTGTSNGYSYSLTETNVGLGIWDLSITSAPATNISGSGSVYSSSYLTSPTPILLNPVFDGGTLKLSSAGNVTQDFTVSAVNGVIDQNGVASNFTGIISDATGASGKLTVQNTGTAGQGSVTLSGVNTYSGGTQVDAGAILSISSDANLGGGSLDLVGSSTVPATLNVTGTTTIDNPITVTGDPVFNITSGTTTTISSSITGTGDVEVSGGGTLELTAANTYTGPTIINSGSTLALSGTGSIANSSAVTNNGYFNIKGASGNVTLGGNYTQGSSGNLAMNFSPGSNQELLVTGTTSLAGSLDLNVSAGTYSAGKYTLLSSTGGLSGTFGTFTNNLSSYSTLLSSLSYDANNVYLNLILSGPATADTQDSLRNTARSLQNIYTLQNAVLANSLGYDCTVFGANNACIYVGGRNTTVSGANGLNNTSGLFVAGYRINPQYRVGAYIDQNLSVSNTGSAVDLSDNIPLVGIFGAWNERLDGTGTEVKVTAAYGQKNVTTTRQVVGTSEAGTGGSQLTSQGVQATIKYGFDAMQDVIVSPYAGMRYTQNNMGGYTEEGSSSVTAPLTYSALHTNATTALAGVSASYKGLPLTTLFASAGVERDTNTRNDSYSASGVSGLTPVDFNSDPVKIRPTAVLGAGYDVAKDQRLGITGIYRQEAYHGMQTATVMATYSIVF